MAIKPTPKQYRFEESMELNNELGELINELESHIESLTDNFMDLTLDPENRKEKEWEELWNSPTDWFEAKLLQQQLSILREVTAKLNKITYTESWITKKQRQPNMDAKESREWLIDTVKPMIRNGVTKQSEIGKKIGIDPNKGLMSRRVQRAYGCNWQDYVTGVQHGRY